MPEHLRALVVILGLATMVFLVARSPACATAIAGADFDRRRNLWIALTLSAFLAHNIWVFLFFSVALLIVAQRKEPNRLAMYFFVLLALPPFAAELSGAGLFNALFDITYVRLLALAVLLPAYLRLRKLPEVEPFGRLLPDKFLAAYLILDLLLMFEHRTLTSILREGVFYAFIDTFLPYYVASRYLRSLEGFRDALMSLVVTVMLLSAVLFFEFLRGWLLYRSLEGALGANIVGANFLLRGANLRASGTAGHAIVAGYVVAVAVAFYLYLKQSAPSTTMWVLGFGLLALGLVGPLSRGPWVGTAAMILIFVATGPAPVQRLAKLGLLGLPVIPVLLGTDVGHAIIDHLPFIGTIEKETVIGRQVLIMVAFEVFLENPLLGTYNVLASQAMEALRGPDGLVDLVNTYVVVALTRGVFGLSLFVGFFLAVLLRLFKALRSLPSKDDESHALGRALLASLMGIMIIIATLSPIFLVPTLYWIVGGLGVAYAQMIARGSPINTGHADSARSTASPRVMGRAYGQR